MCWCTRPRLGTLPCQRLAVAFHLTAPSLLALISLIVPPVLLSPLWHRHLQQYFCDAKKWYSGKYVTFDHTLTSASVVTARFHAEICFYCENVDWNHWHLFVFYFLDWPGGLVGFYPKLLMISTSCEPLSCLSLPYFLSLSTRETKTSFKVYACNIITWT